MDGKMDICAGFVAATCAPALIAALITIPLLGPVAFLVLLVAFAIALTHVLLVAIPLYLLIKRWWTPGPGTVLIAAPLIGTVPVTLLAGVPPDPSTLLFTLSGFVGGCAFLFFANRERMDE